MSKSPNNIPPPMRSTPLQYPSPHSPEFSAPNPSPFARSIARKAEKAAREADES